MIEYIINTIKAHGVAGVCIVSIVIFIVGALKKKWFGKIQNEHIKRAVTFTAGIFSSYAGTAGYFLWEKMAWDKYWFAGAVCSAACIVAYQFLRNYGVTTAVCTIARVTFKGIKKVAFYAFLGDKAKAQKAYDIAKQEVEATVKAEVRSLISTDHDLDSL